MDSKGRKNERQNNPAIQTTEVRENTEVSEGTEAGTPEFLQITTLNANKEEVEITVPYNSTEDCHSGFSSS